MTKTNLPLDHPSDESLFRYQVLSQVLTRKGNGESRAQAVDAVAAIIHVAADGTVRRVSRRSLYRWLADFEAHGFRGLLPAERSRTRASEVLAQPLLDFFASEKRSDPAVTAPELIRRARERGLIGPHETVARVTVWRAIRRLGLPTSRVVSARNRDCRRFSYPYRLDMVLCDGKHFRAGPGRLRRVALFFLDDATRMTLGAVVDTSENARLFLRGLFEVIQAYGLMGALYVDNGSGFVANDVIAVLRNLGILFIHGTAGYPEGRGKIERFNRTAKEQALRFLDGNPEVDPGCAALELRIRHYLFEQYCHAPHEGLKGESPWSRFHADARPLRFAQNVDLLREAFVLHKRRRVSLDNVVSLHGVSYEVIRGHAGERVILHHNVLDDTVAIIHDGKRILLAPVDLHANARDRRSPAKGNEEQTRTPSQSSAELAFGRAFRPIVNTDGGFSHNDNQEDKS